MVVMNSTDGERRAGNDDTRVAWHFHERTKYVPDDTYSRILMDTGSGLVDAIWEEDPALEPFPYKIYPTLDPIPLPRPDEGRAGDHQEPVPGGVTLADIGRITLLSNGVLGRRTTTRSGRVIEYRAAGGTGARYHLEEYLICGDLPGLPAGIYHYGAHDHALRCLRRGDYRGVVVAATGGEPATAAAPVVLAVTSTFWRNAWRYRERAYRHAYWDAGTTLSQVMAVAAAAGLPATLVLGYVDATLNRLLGVDGVREAVVALCAIGRTSEPPRSPTAGAADIPPLALPTRPISAGEIPLPDLHGMHAASRLDSPDDVRRWREAALTRTRPEPRGPVVPLTPVEVTASVEDAIVRRRSTRHYDTAAKLPFDALSTVLDLASRELPADCLAPGAPPLHDCYLIVHDVDELAAGTYVQHDGFLELLYGGDHREAARRIACNQWYVADAHVNAYYLTDLRLVLDAYGNRGYRLAQLEAALHAGWLHLATHGWTLSRDVRLGAVGSTSYDDEVVEFFGPHAAGKSYMFVTVFGRRRPAPSARAGK